MNFWGAIPFVRIIIPFCGGILLYLLTDFHFPEWAVYGTVLLTIILHAALNRRLLRIYRFAPLAGFIFQGTLFISANHLCYSSYDLNHDDHYTQLMDGSDLAIVKITEPLSEKEKTLKAEVKLIALHFQDSWTRCEGKAILYLKKDSESYALNYGNFLLIQNRLAEIPPPKNPDEFNYKKYLSCKEVYASAFLNEKNWRLLPVTERNPVREFVFWLREKSRNAFEKNISLPREKAVDEALVFGYKDDMSFELTQLYAAAGVIHVLAVSGLHVAILYTILNWMFKFLVRRRNGKFIHAIFIIGVIWVFALLTGLSGSVFRAAVMFTFISGGKIFSRSGSIYNVLASSALVILLFNPMLIMDIGFQLSYLAVIGIAAIYPYINLWVTRENKIVDYFWKLIAISIAATIATMPPALFYFHQFPAYFLFANIVVIPLSGMILVLGLALIILQFIEPIALLLGKIITGLTFLMNEYIVSIKGLPGSVISLPHIHVMSAILIGWFCISAIQFLIHRRKDWLFSGLASLLFIVTTQSMIRINNSGKSTFTVYSFNGKSCLEFYHARNCVLVKSDTAFSYEENFYLEKHHQLQGAVNEQRLSLDDLPSKDQLLSNQLLINNNCFRFRNFSVAVINKNLPVNITPNKFSVDALVICGNPYLHIKNILSYYDPAMIIFDGSNSAGRIRYWKSALKEYNIPMHDVRTVGAYLRDLQSD